jgi:DNA-binding SARP family transcriptional activator
MKMGLLGSLSLWSDGSEFVPSAPKVRQLLAFLMINANVMVRSSDCVDEIWDCEPPKSWASTVQTYVLQIRRAFQAAGAEDTLLVTRTPGYQLVGRHVDWLAFTDLARSGRAAAEAGDDRAASTLLSEALRLWRGPVLADVDYGPLSVAKVTELAESRMVALEQRIEADLRLGRHGQLVGELEALTEEHPTHENLHAQCMVAQYRSGYESLALRTYDRLQAVLADSLGIDPTPRLRRLRRAIATHAAVLAPPRAVVPAARVRGLDQRGSGSAA